MAEDRSPGFKPEPDGNGGNDSGTTDTGGTDRRDTYSGSSSKGGQHRIGHARQGGYGRGGSGRDDTYSGLPLQGGNLPPGLAGHGGYDGGSPGKDDGSYKGEQLPPGPAGHGGYDGGSSKGGQPLIGHVGQGGYVDRCGLSDGGKLSIGHSECGGGGPGIDHGTYSGDLYKGEQQPAPGQARQGEYDGGDSYTDRTYSDGSSKGDHPPIRQTRDSGRGPGTDVTYSCGSYKGEQPPAVGQPPPGLAKQSGTGHGGPCMQGTYSDNSRMEQPPPEKLEHGGSDDGNLDTHDPGLDSSKANQSAGRTGHYEPDTDTGDSPPLHKIRKDGSSGDGKLTHNTYRDGSQGQGGSSDGGPDAHGTVSGDYFHEGQPPIQPRIKHQQSTVSGDSYKVEQASLNQEQQNPPNDGNQEQHIKRTAGSTSKENLNSLEELHFSTSEDFDPDYDDTAVGNKRPSPTASERETPDGSYENTGQGTNIEQCKRKEPLPPLCPKPEIKRYQGSKRKQDHLDLGKVPGMSNTQGEGGGPHGQPPVSVSQTPATSLQITGFDGSADSGSGNRPKTVVNAQKTSFASENQLPNTTKKQTGAFVGDKVKNIENKNKDPRQSGSSGQSNSTPTSVTKQHQQSEGAFKGQVEDGFEMIGFDTHNDPHDEENSDDEDSSSIETINDPEQNNEDINEITSGVGNLNISKDNENNKPNIAQRGHDNDLVADMEEGDITQHQNTENTIGAENANNDETLKSPQTNTFDEMVDHRDKIVDKDSKPLTGAIQKTNSTFIRQNTPIETDSDDMKLHDPTKLHQNRNKDGSDSAENNAHIETSRSMQPETENEKAIGTAMNTQSSAKGVPSEPVQENGVSKYHLTPNNDDKSTARMMDNGNKTGPGNKGVSYANVEVLKYSIEKHGTTWCIRDLQSKRLIPQKHIIAKNIELESSELVKVDGIFYQVIISSKGKPKLEKQDDSDSDSSQPRTDACQEKAHHPMASSTTLEHHAKEKEQRKSQDVSVAQAAVSITTVVEPVGENQDVAEQTQTERDKPDSLKRTNVSPASPQHAPVYKQTGRDKNIQGSSKDNPGSSEEDVHTQAAGFQNTQAAKGEENWISVSKCVIDMVQSTRFKEAFIGRCPGVNLDINALCGKIVFSGDGDLEKVKVWFGIESQIHSVEFDKIRKEVANHPDAIDTVLRHKYGQTGTVFWDINTEKRCVNICSCGHDKPVDVRTYLTKAIQVVNCKYSFRSETILQSLRVTLSTKFSVCAIYNSDNTLQIINYEPREVQSEIGKEAENILNRFGVKVLKIHLKPRLCGTDELVNNVRKSGVEVINVQINNTNNNCLMWTFKSRTHARLEVNSEEITEMRADIIVDKATTTTKKLEFQGNQAKIFIPCRMTKTKMGDHVMAMFNEVMEQGQRSICISIPHDTDNVVLTSIWWATTNICVSKQAPDMIVFSCKDTRSFSQCAYVFTLGTLPDVWCEGHPLITSAHDDKNTLSVTIEKGLLNETKADVLVNSIGTDLKLDQGQISNELLKSAGDELKHALTNQRSSINVGEFVATKSFRLENCHWIFHGAVGKYSADKPDVVKLMKQLVANCIETADNKKLKSIAFPALGTGNRRFPCKVAARAIFEAIEETQFMLKNIRSIKIIIYEKDTEMLKEFSDVKEKWLHSFDSVRSSSPVITLNNISARAVCKPIQEVACDLLLVLSTKSVSEKLKCSVCTFLDHAWDSNLNNKLTQSLSSTLSQNDPKTVCIYVKNENILLEHVGERFMNFIKSIDKSAKTLRIELAFDDSKLKSVIFSSFTSEMDKLVAMTVEGQIVKVFDVVETLLTSGVEVLEMSDQVDNISEAEAGRTKEFDGTRMKDTNPLKEPGKQTITRGVNLVNGSLLTKGLESNILIVEGISPNTTERQLKLCLKSILNKYSPQLVFCDQRSDALLVFTNDQGSKSVFESSVRINGLSLKEHPKLALFHFVYVIKNDVCQKLKESGVLEFICSKRLMEPYFRHSEIDAQGNLRVVSQTMYGVNYVKYVINEFAFKSYENVSELKYDCINAKHASDICGPDNTDGDLSYVTGTIKLVCRKSVLATHDKYISKLIEYEGEKEIPLGDDGLNKADDWCIEFEKENFECAFVKEKCILVVLFELYEDVRKVNLKLSKLRNESKSGIASRHRGGNIEVLNEGEASGISNSNTASFTQSVHDPGLSPENVRKYKAHSGIIVYVYKGDICNLNVDCIVNAANSQLDHAGGVAGAIQKKAGYDLKKEGDDYIRHHGEIKVGSVVKTNSGKLPYKYVLHAVGPRWGDYNTRSQRGVDCSQDLQNAVFNSFLKASELKMKSVALPAISSAIFGVPIDICTKQYVEAVLLYCRVSGDSSLREIHFVDIVMDVVTKIQSRFDEYVKAGELLGADNIGTDSLPDTNTKVKPNQTNGFGFRTETKAASISEQELKEQGTCVICMDDFTNPKKLACGHIFCTDCINQSLAVKQACPTCGQVCGIIKGDQPPGSMTVSRESWSHCVGYEHVGRICISYNFNSGSQTAHHPAPGKWYKGITRRGFLPDNKEGADVCRMLKVAFERKLVFTIGRSRTTGEEGVITWNDIHHKTDHRPNMQFGYPDPSYLERVTDELKAKGVTHDDINRNEKLEGTVYSH